MQRKFVQKRQLQKSEALSFYHGDVAVETIDVGDMSHHEFCHTIGSCWVWSCVSVMLFATTPWNVDDAQW